MIRTVSGVLGLVVACHALAADTAGADKVSFDLKAVTVGDLSRVVLDDVLKGSVVLDADVLRDQEQISFSLKQVSKDVAFRQLSAVLKSRGFSVSRLDGVYHVHRAGEVAEEVMVYMPRYRSVSYLSDLVGGLIPHGAIATQRTIGAMDGGTVPMMGGPSSAVASGVQTGQVGQLGQGVQRGRAAPPVQGNQLSGTGYESPTSAAGLLDKSEKDALVIKARPDQLAQVRKILEEVDRPVPEMLVKAVVMEVQTGSVEASAVNLLASVVHRGAGVSLAVTGGADKTNAVSFKVDKLEAVWSAISTDKRFKVLSAPQIRVKSGGSARFSVGADVPVLGAVSYDRNGQAIQSVEYKPSGVILDLRPEIRGELAELKIFQQLSNFARTETGVNNSPTLLKRELSSSVVVGQNDVVLLGGLDEEKSSEDDSGLFFLPRWMRSHGSDKSRSEIVLMLYVERVQAPGERI